MHKFVDVKICNVCRKKRGLLSAYKKSQQHLAKGTFLTPCGVGKETVYKRVIACYLPNVGGGPIIYEDMKPPEDCPFYLEHFMNKQKC